MGCRQGRQGVTRGACKPCVKLFSPVSCHTASCSNTLWSSNKGQGLFFSKSDTSLCPLQLRKDDIMLTSTYVHTPSTALSHLEHLALICRAFCNSERIILCTKKHAALLSTFQLCWDDTVQTHQGRTCWYVQVQHCLTAKSVVQRNNFHPTYQTVYQIS